MKKHTHYFFFKKKLEFEIIDLIMYFEFTVKYTKGGSKEEGSSC